MTVWGTVGWYIRNKSKRSLDFFQLIILDDFPKVRL